MVQRAGRAQRVVTVSEFSRREIADIVGIDAGRMRVVRNGIPPPADVAPRFLARLALAGTGRDPGPDPFAVVG